MLLLELGGSYATGEVSSMGGGTISTHLQSTSVIARPYTALHCTPSRQPRCQTVANKMRRTAELQPGIQAELSTGRAAGWLQAARVPGQSYRQDVCFRPV